ncbi:hypothetical protein MTR_3g112330 [Medicago truncatula]|uniref:Uncharacterized protein n=1 Tax=Medicago truncatula TaxID=3880 RepID=A0A072V3F2_MEDTR|nr:hypothetical protein MTR_3g112330 [Medicago truncatula]
MEDAKVSVLEDAKNGGGLSVAFSIAFIQKRYFLHCDLGRNVWLNVMLWLDLNFIMPPNLLIHWECWSGGLIHKKIRKGLRMIWEVVIWVLWKARNDRIFNNENAPWDELVEKVKVLSWRWLLGRSSTPALLVSPGQLCCPAVMTGPAADDAVCASPSKGLGSGVLDFCYGCFSFSGFLAETCSSSAVKTTSVGLVFGV